MLNKKYIIIYTHLKLGKFQLNFSKLKFFIKTQIFYNFFINIYYWNIYISQTDECKY